MKCIHCNYEGPVQEFRYLYNVRLEEKTGNRGRVDAATVPYILTSFLFNVLAFTPGWILILIYNHPLKP